MFTQVLQELASTARPARDAHPFADHKSALTRCLGAIGAWIVRRGQRKALRYLAQDDRLLRDIGLTREQALREADKPFWRW